MKVLERKRVIAARILLAVFLPMMICLSLHTHQTTTYDEGECYECAHHLHHSGHITIAKASLHDCLLCQMCHLPFLTATAVTISFTVYSLNAFYGEKDQAVIIRAKGIFQTRAPPFI